MLRQDDTLTWEPRAVGTFGAIRKMSLLDICVITTVETQPNTMYLHCLTVHDKDPNLARVYFKHEFKFITHLVGFNSPNNNNWISELRARLGRIHNNSSRKPILAIVNPFSGTKKGASIWKDECEPLFTAAELKFEAITTERSGHAYELAAALNCEKYSGIVTVGGDGILCEVLNGIMARDDWRQALSGLVISPIAAGTGNAASHSLYNNTSPAACVCHVLRGATRRMDMFLATQPQTSHYMWGILSGEFGIVADVDFGSERVRFLGSLRSAVWGLLRIIANTSYRCKLTYLPCDRDRNLWHGVKCTRDCQVCRSALLKLDEAEETKALETAEQEEQKPKPVTPKRLSAPQVKDETPFTSEESSSSSTITEVVKTVTPAPQLEKHVSTALSFDDDWINGLPSRFADLFPFPRYTVGHAPPQGWVSKDVTFGFGTFMKLPWLMPGLLAAPFAHLADGCMDVAYANSEDCTRFQFLKFVGSIGEAAHVYNPKLQYLKVKSFTLEPLDANGEPSTSAYLGVDGERIPCSPLQFHIGQGFLTTFCYC